MEFHSEIALFLNKPKNPHPINKRTPNKWITHALSKIQTQKTTSVSRQQFRQKSETQPCITVCGKSNLGSVLSQRTQGHAHHDMLQFCLQNHLNCKISFLMFMHKRVVCDTHEYKITITGTGQQQVDWRKKAPWNYRTFASLYSLSLILHLTKNQILGN